VLQYGREDSDWTVVLSWRKSSVSAGCCWDDRFDRFPVVCIISVLGSWFFPLVPQKMNCNHWMVFCKLGNNHLPFLKKIMVQAIWPGWSSPQWSERPRHPPLRPEVFLPSVTWWPLHQAAVWVPTLAPVSVTGDAPDVPPYPQKHSENILLFFFFKSRFRKAGFPSVTCFYSSLNLS
jgi:hypothetical protein